MVGAPLLGTALGDFHSDDLRKLPKVPVSPFSQLFPSHLLPQRSWIEQSRQKMNNMDLKDRNITEGQQKTWC